MADDLRTWEAIRQTVNCPTCGGSGRQEVEGMPTMHCPDCTDGKIDMARLLAVGAAVFTAEKSTKRQNDSRLFGFTINGEFSWESEVIDHLRAVRP